MQNCRRREIVPWIISVLVIVILSSGVASSDESSASGSARFDGPAELPRESVQSSLKDTPSAGRTWTVSAGQNLEQTLTSASCGDVVELQAGATFSGKFELPNKNCDDAHWIILRTSAADSTLPPEGTRLTPCYAGVPLLAGRPRWSCSSPANVLARIEYNGAGGSGPILFAAGANHYRLMGLEVTRAASSAAVYNLIDFKGPADHLIFDRMWLHGTAQGDTVRGIFLGSTRYVAVVDSFFSDFHCVSRSGPCGDTQAVSGGIGDSPSGPYKIVNNFLEAAGENIMFGGGPATAPPRDIEIRRNHLFKPLSWMKGQAEYVGGADGNPFVAKNLLEFKNGQRVLVEGNILENAWGGFSQVGFAILLTPKNQAGGRGSNLCNSCEVTDVTIRYNTISHVAAGLQITNALSDNGGAAVDGQRYSIHDIVIDDLDGAKYGGPGEFAQVSVGAGAPLLQNVTINHVTAFPAHTLLMIGDMVATSGPMKNFVFTNNIVNAGAYPVWSTGGGPGNCAFHDVPETTFSACFSNSTFAGNAIIAAPSSYSAGSWPPHNFFPASAAAVRFANYNGGNGGDYHLQSSSPCKGKGTDGKDPGADLDAIHSAVAGVE